MVFFRTGKTEPENIIGLPVFHIAANQVKSQVSKIIGNILVIRPNEFRTALHPLHIAVADFDTPHSRLFRQQVFIGKQAYQRPGGAEITRHFTHCLRITGCNDKVVRSISGIL